MTDLLNTLFRSLSPLWEMSVTAAYAAAVVIVLRLLLKKRAPRKVLCLLWLVVFARLLIPVSLESPLSIVPGALPGQEYAVEQAPPEVGNPVVPAAPQDTVQNHPQNQPENGTLTPVTGSQNPSLSVPEGVGPSVPTPEVAFPWQAAVAGVWLTGAAAMGGCALVSWLRLRRRLFDAIRAGDGVWEHPTVDSPFILGVLRPRIYLPLGLTGQPRQFILCHEYAHLRRFDHIVKPVCWIALALHWFNPLAWAAFLLMSRDIEAACDEAVLHQLGSGIKADYSDTLLALAAGRRFPAPCPLAFDEGDARGRIRNVLNYRRPAFWAVVISVVTAALAAVCLLTDPVAAKAEGDPDPDPDASNSQDSERLDRELDLDRDGVPEYVRVADDDGVGQRLDLWEEDELLWTGKASYYGGGTSYLLYSADGEDYLMEFALGGHQGSGYGDYRIFTLENGVETTVRKNSVWYAYCDFVGTSTSVKDDFDPETVAVFVDEVESLLERCTLLVDTGSNYWEDSSGRLRVNLRITLETYGNGFTWDDSRTTLENMRAFRASYLANETAGYQTDEVYAIDTAAPLDAPIVDPNGGIPEDPDQWYKVAELPDDMIRMYSRNYGAETLLRWDSNLYMVFDHIAHTSLGIMPRLKKLSNDPNFFGPLAVISNVGKGTGIFIDELVVYDLDAAEPMMDYTHDWTSLQEDFNENVSWQFDKNTRTLTYTYQGQTVKAAIDANDEARLRIEHDYPDIEQKDLRLCITGEFVYYRFDETDDGGIRIELPVSLYVGNEVVPLIVPGWVGWTLRFNGGGFDTVHESCVLGYPGYNSYQ